MRAARDRRIVVVGSSLRATGGIPHYMAGVVAALRGNGDVAVVELKLGNGPVARLLYAIVGLFRVLISRPDLIVLSHVGLVPVGLVAARLSRAKTAVLAYGVEVWGERKAAARHFESCDAVWPISGFTSDEVRKASPGAALAPPLYGRISQRYFTAFLTRSTQRKQTLSLLMVSRLDDLSYKGFDLVLDALGSIRATCEVELTIVGEGAEAERLIEWVNGRDLGDVVRCTGGVSERELVDLYSHADLNIVATRFRRGPNPLGEGLGLTVLEAAATGCPSIVPDEGASQEVVVHGVSGLHFRSGSAVSLAAALMSAQQMGRSGLNWMGREARRMAMASHTAIEFDGRLQRAVAQVLGDEEGIQT